ncbi:hypothetical protein PAMA_017527 [Pampus argenteus]
MTHALLMLLQTRPAVYAPDVTQIQRYAPRALALLRWLHVHRLHRRESVASNGSMEIITYTKRKSSSVMLLHACIQVSLSSFQRVFEPLCRDRGKLRATPA